MTWAPGAVVIHISVSFMRQGALQGLGGGPELAEPSAPRAPRTECIRAKDPLSVCCREPGDPVLVPGMGHESDSQTKMEKEDESSL